MEPDNKSNQKEFFKTLNKSSIKTFVKSSIDIIPILKTFTVKELLRSSNTHRIGDLRTYVTKNALHLMIIVLKEKRKKQPVERPCQIAAYLNSIMYTVKNIMNISPDLHQNHA
ncbi:hypothetical protein BB561_000564 [Smittium simulii]|uniref:Uncharacterized protein n=1 Tax=Smittium simulii TaxID=133385 RepID=A0A2T9YYN4_9FUNG|nr:hypothetical protein BB561_000564 [Smittium simulii]